MLTKEEFRDRCDRERNSRARRFQVWEQQVDPEDTVAGIQDTLHNGARLLGGCAFRFEGMGDTGDARAWFAEAALRSRVFLQEYVTRYDDIGSGYDAKGGVHACNGLYSAILAGDGRLVAVLVDDVVNLVEEAPNKTEIHRDGYYREARTVAALVEDDLGRAAEELSAFQDVIANKYDEIVDTTHQAFVADDAPAVEAGVADLVALHAETVDSRKTWNQPISLSACAHLKLAHHLGMDVWIDSEFVPDQLQTYELDARIDLPHPEYVDEALIPA